MSKQKRVTIQWGSDAAGRPMATVHTREGLAQPESRIVARIEPRDEGGAVVLWGSSFEKPTGRSEHRSILAARSAIVQHVRERFA